MASCVFAWSTTDGISTRRFDARGEPGADAAAVSATTGFRAPRIAWDGQEYVLAAAVTHVGPDDLVATWLDANGAVTGGGFITVASGALGSAIPLRIAADQSRHAVVSYMRFQDRLAVGYQIAPPPVEAPDAGDAGPEPSPEAGPPPDAGNGAADASGPTNQESPEGESGCGCSVPTTGGGPGMSLGGVGLLAILTMWRRRRAATRTAPQR